MVLSGALILWLGRGMTFWGDELALVITSPHLSLNDALQPHEGHLVLTARVVYKVILEAFGDAYLPFRLLTLGTILLTISLFFVYASRRVGYLVALAPSLALLLFGSDSEHVLLGNGFIVLLAVACGLGALLALERGDRLGDAGACALLCLGVATYSVALAFIAGAGVGILLGDDRRRRIWIVAVPALLYVAWSLWSLGVSTGSREGASLLQALLLPAWGFQSLSTVLAALTGFGHQFSATAPAPQVGAPLSVLALVGLAWRFSRGPVPRTLWVALTALLVLWLLGVLLANPTWRSPSDPRYLFPWTIIVLLVGVEAAAGLRWSRLAVCGLYAVAIGGLAVNAVQLRDQATELRGVNTVQTKAALTGLELAGHRALAEFFPRPLDGVTLPLLEEQSPLAIPFSALPPEDSVSRGFRVAIERYGQLGYPPTEIPEHGEPAGAQVDAMLVGALDLRLKPARRPATGASCRTGDSAGATVRLPRGGAVLMATGAATEVQVRRFSTGRAFGVGTLSPGQSAVLRIPADRASAPWWAYAPAAGLTVCALR